MQAQVTFSISLVALRLPPTSLDPCHESVNYPVICSASQVMRRECAAADGRRRVCLGWLVRAAASDPERSGAGRTSGP